MRLPNRRRFLLTALGACGPLGLGAAGWCRWNSNEGDADTGASTAALPGPALQTATESGYALGAQVAITALHADDAVARRAVAAAMAELRQVEALLSIYRPDSPLSQLNRHGVLEKPHPYLVRILRHCEEMARRSRGAFDVTVQPLWTLYTEAHQVGQLPEAAAVAAALRHVDWRRVEVSAERMRLHGEGTAMTLNGIAQGFAADRAMEILRRHGIRHALVDAGEIAAEGQKAGSEPWTVGIQHPRREDAYVWLAKLRGRCLATSGDYATCFSDDYRYNHLFDPATGRSPEFFASVSIAAPTATLADALSTAVFVLGAEEGLKLVRAMPGVDALFVFKSGRVFVTEGFPG